MSGSLHTKYRPSTFKEVIGQKEVVKSIQRTVKEGSAHAFIFTGDAGCGKTTLARIMANAFAAKHAGSGNEFNNRANIIEADAATNTGVDAMRNIVSKTVLRAVGGSPVRAVIIDEAHRLSGQAWDSLLKAIEEPPAHVYWFFCTTNAGKIPKTIKTRCITYEVKPLSEEDLTEVLMKAVEGESLEIEVEILEVIAENSGGSPRQALVHLEACRFAEDEREAAKIVKGTVEKKEVIDLCRLLIDRRTKSWTQIMKLLKDLEGTEAETIRILVSNYFAKAAMGAKSEKEAVRLLMVLDAFSETYNPSDKYAPLLLSIGNALGFAD